MFKKYSVLAVFLCLILLFSSCYIRGENKGIDNPEDEQDKSPAPAETSAPVETPPLDEESSGAETLPPDSGSDSAPVPSETPVSSEDEQYIKIIDSMTLEEKLGQLLIVGYPSDRQAEKLIKEYKVGGYCIIQPKL